jgi:hypothetical protein
VAWKLLEEICLGRAKQSANQAAIDARGTGRQLRKQGKQRIAAENAPAELCVVPGPNTALPDVNVGDHGDVRHAME